MKDYHPAVNASKPELTSAGAKTSVRLLDLQAQYASIRPEIEAAVKEVLESQQCILGPKVEECEKAVAEYSQARFGVGMSSGTDALLAALMVESIGPGDEVITTPYTFFATAGSIARTGARPVFVDIDPATFNLDSSLLEKAVNSRTRAIIPVHLYGQTAEMDPILDIARKRKLVVIEDAAQAIGAEYRGRRAGSMGEYGCFSFFPSKNLGAAGDGGMVVTSDAERAKKLRIFRNHGSEPKYIHPWIGGNFRLDALQAAIVTVKLRHLDRWTEARQNNAARYEKLFEATQMMEHGFVELPKTAAGRHIFNQYVIRAQDRDRLRDFLKERGIDTEIYYPLPLHLQECFKYLGHREGDFPHSEKAARETLALPIYPELSDAQAERVVESIHRFYS